MEILKDLERVKVGFKEVDKMDMNIICIRWYADKELNMFVFYLKEADRQHGTTEKVIMIPFNGVDFVMDVIEEYEGEEFVEYNNSQNGSSI